MGEPVASLGREEVSFKADGSSLSHLESANSSCFCEVGILFEEEAEADG